MKLYNMELSGNCYKIRLFCALLGLECESVAVELFKGEHKSAAFLQLNPRGQMPVLDDYPQVRQWIARIQALPGYVGMPGL
jgi:glutathione S-transferase